MSTISHRLRENGLKIKELNSQVCAILDGADAENRMETAEEKAQIQEYNKQIEALDQEASQFAESIEIREAALKRQAILPPGAEGEADMEILRRAGISGLFDTRKARMSAGQKFLADKGIKDFLKAMVPDSKPDAEVRRAEFGMSPQVDLGEYPFKSSLITEGSATSGGAFVTPDYKPLVDQGTFYRPLVLRDLINQATTNSNTVSYVRQGTHTNNAAPTGEATATDDGTGNKPESAAVFARITETVKTIPTWLPATRQVLQDAGQLMDIINNLLRYDCEEDFEREIISGDGTGDHFTGILNVSGLSTQTFSGDIVTTSRKAKTKVKTLGRAYANGWLLNPYDWEAFDLTTDSEDRYYFGGPATVFTPRLWGLPVVESESISQYTGIVADWQLATIWDRMMFTILISDSHSDFFTRNLIAILGEFRAAFGVIRPAAFVSTTLH